MAKALFGHVGISSDLRLAAEVRQLRLRVRELEEELARARQANDVLAQTVVVVDGVDESSLREPALT
ncbi:MAG: hypothetical protein ACYDB7_00400 [Mycobacteriales bacterium]